MVSATYDEISIMSIHHKISWAAIESLTPADGQDPDFQDCLAAFPALELAKTTPQDPRYHAEGDVWTHTQMVVRELLALPGYQQASHDERTTLFLAALLHDVAKHATTVIDPVTGAIGQPGHSRRGAIDARVTLWSAGAPFEEREAICRLISHHQVPFFAIDGTRKGKSAEFTARELSWQLDLRLLSTLAEADMRGRICADMQRVLDNIELFAELAKEDGCWGQARAFADDHTRVSYFRGAQVHPDYPLFQQAGSQVTMMAGLPASGKNTYVETHPQLKGMPVVSFDDAREDLGLVYGDNDGAAAHLVIDRAKALLRQKAPFVWNATNVNAQLRQKALDLLYAYGAQVKIVYLEPARQELFARNAKRDSTLSNSKLEQMLWKWEPPLHTEVHEMQVLASSSQPSKTHGKMTRSA